MPLFKPNDPSMAGPSDMTDQTPPQIVNPNAPVTQTAATQQNTQSNSVTMPNGIDPRLAAVYQQAGMNPAGQGTGFADWQYWQDKANQSGDWNYFTNRLSNDLAGKGTDQATGTPGQGPWQQSGQGQGGGTGQLISALLGGLQPFQVQSGMSPAQLSSQAAQVQPSQLGNTQSDLLNTLLSRISPTNPRI